MVRGLQSPIFRGARNSVGFWDHSLFLFPNLSLSSSPTSLFLCLCPSLLPRFSIFSSIFISLRIRFSRASFTPLHYVYFFPVFSLLPTLIPSLRIPITYVCIYFLAPNIHTLLYLLLVLLIIVAIARCFRTNLKKKQTSPPYLNVVISRWSPIKLSIHQQANTRSAYKCTRIISSYTETRRWLYKYLTLNMYSVTIFFSFFLRYYRNSTGDTRNSSNDTSLFAVKRNYVGIADICIARQHSHTKQYNGSFQSKRIAFCSRGRRNEKHHLAILLPS